MTWASNLFIVVFLGQIFVSSYYFPEKLLGRMRHVLKTYPPSEYPKLYPRSVEYYRMGHWVFAALSRTILVIGLLILVAIIFVVDHSSFADDGFISEAWPAGFGILQFIPLMLVEFTEISQFKQMRKVNPATTRKAELRRRSLLDFVSPAVVGSTVFLFFAAIAFDLFVNDFVIGWRHVTLQRAIVLTVTNLLLAAVGAWNLYGLKLDPHQASEDRSRQIEVSLKSLFLVSMALSVFFMMQAADGVFGLDFLDAIVMSLYFQLIVFLSIGHVLRNLKVEDIDFEVYKSETAVT